MNGFFPASLLVGISQWWQTRDQGDSLAVARRIADIVGVDYYPRHALVGLGGRTLYVDGARGFWQRRARKQLFAWARASSRATAHDLRGAGRAVGGGDDAAESARPGDV